MPDVINRLLDIICRCNVVIEKDEIPLDQGLMQAGILDSYGLVEMVLEMEREFDIAIDEEEITPENFKDLKTIADFIRRKCDEG